MTEPAATVAELVHRNLMDVFNERDPERRARAIAATYDEDVVWYDPEGPATGRAALQAKAQALLDGAPGPSSRRGGRSTSAPAASGRSPGSSVRPAVNRSPPAWTSRWCRTG